MKNITYLLIFVLSTLVTYLLCNIFWSFLADVPYVVSLRHPSNMFGLLMIYIWPGIAIISDLEDKYT